MDEAIAEHRRARELDPLTPVHPAYRGLLCSFQGGHADVLTEARKAMAFDPNAGAAGKRGAQAGTPSPFNPGVVLLDDAAATI
jgi:hypothetical protein